MKIIGIILTCLLVVSAGAPLADSIPLFGSQSTVAAPQSESAAGAEPGEMNENLRGLAEQLKELKLDTIAQFKSPEWQAQVREIKSMAAEIKSQLNSPEWQEEMRRLKEEVKNLKGEMKTLDQIKSRLDDPEWQEKMRQLEQAIEKIFREHQQ